MARLKKFYWDVETAGLDFSRHPILQFAAIIEINGREVERLNWLIKPYDWANCDPIALEINNVKNIFDKTPDIFITQKEFYDLLIKTLGKYINKFDTTDKFYMIGYNSHAFDAQFLRALFIANGNNFFGSYFWNPNVDVMLIAMAACIGQRHLLGNFKLGTVAKSLGVEVDPNRLHDGIYDVEITKEIFEILSKELGLE